MAFTSSDLDAVDRAIVALASGTRAEEVTFSDGRKVRYSAATLPDLRELRAMIAGAVAPMTQDPATMVGGVTFAEWTRG